MTGHIDGRQGAPEAAKMTVSVVGHLSADEIVSERCPDCLLDPKDDTLHRDGCRRIFDRGDPREDLQFGPPWKPWRWR